MSYSNRNKGRGRSGSTSYSHYSEHDDRLDPPRGNFNSDNFHRKIYSNRGNFRRGGTRYHGNRGHNNNYRGNFRSNRGRRPYGNRGAGYRYSTKDNDDRNDASPFHTDKDGDVDMDGGEESTNSRYNPYARPAKKRNSGYSNRSDTSDVLNGSSLDEDWLIDEIQTMSKIQFQPFEYHLDNDSAVFFTQDQSVTDAIYSCNKRIVSPDGSKVTFVVKRAMIPPIDLVHLNRIKEVLEERFSEANQHIDLSSFYHEEKLKDFRIKFSTFYHAFVVGKLIADHISALTSIDLSNNSLRSCGPFKYLVSRTPSVKKLNLKKNQLNQLKELACFQQWDLTELTLDQNPLCASFKSQTEYISEAREYFPNLLILDGHALTPPVKFDVDSGKLPQTIRDFLSPNGQTLINQFIQQYFLCYDQSRMDLLNAYSDVALLSITIPSSPRGPSLSKYFEFNRNLKRIKKSGGGNVSKLYSSRTQVVNKLALLPPTQHFASSFAIDVPLVTSQIVNFIVRGFFNEKGTDDTRLRAFSRSFFCQVQQSSLQIINEQYFIRNLTAAELKEAKTLDPTSVSPLFVQTPTGHPEMIASFAKESGMNERFSEQCLQENGWDYQKAANVFLQLKSEGKIPPEAYVK